MHDIPKGIAKDRVKLGNIWLVTKFPLELWCFTEIVVEQTNNTKLQLLEWIHTFCFCFFFFFQFFSFIFSMHYIRSINKCRKRTVVCVLPQQQAKMLVVNVSLLSFFFLFCSFLRLFLQQPRNLCIFSIYVVNTYIYNLLKLRVDRCCNIILLVLHVHAIHT